MRREIGAVQVRGACAQSPGGGADGVRLAGGQGDLGLQDRPGLAAAALQERLRELAVSARQMQPHQRDERRPLVVEAIEQLRRLFGPALAQAQLGEDRQRQPAATGAAAVVVCA